MLGWFVAVAVAASPAELPDRLVVASVADGVHVFTAQPWSATSLIVEATDGPVVWVDTPPTPVQATRILGWIRARVGPDRPIVAVNSHHHLDPTGGNQVLAEAGIPVYGGDRTPRELAARGEDLRAGTATQFAEDAWMTDQLAGLVPTPPDHTFPIEGRLTLPIGSETLVLIHPGHAHSADNIVAWFPERRILYGGCMVKDGTHLGYLAEADVTSWQSAIAVLLALDPRIVVPGHGERRDPGLLTHTADLVASTLDATGR